MSSSSSDSEQPSLLSTSEDESPAGREVPHRRWRWPLVLGVIGTAALGFAALAKTGRSPVTSDLARTLMDDPDSDNATSLTAAGDVTGLAVLALTHNHAEHWEVDRSRRVKVLEEVAAAIERSGRPAIVTMSSQEVKGDGWLPLQKAIELPELSRDYVWVGHSDISGWTKFMGNRVNTAVQVALRSDMLVHIKGVRAEHCGEQVRGCTTHDSSETKFRFFTWPMKATKGQVAVLMRIGPFTLRLLGAHLDTQSFVSNLRHYTGPQVGKWELSAAGVSILAADFNNRIDPNRPIAATLCREENGLSQLDQWLNVSRTHFEEDLQIKAIRDALQHGARDYAVDCELSAKINSPFAINGSALPTYKLPEDAASLLAKDIHSQANALFGHNGSDVCKGHSPNIGVLDHIAWIVREGADSKFKVTETGPRIWAALPGSDHALVGAVLQLALAE